MAVIHLKLFLIYRAFINRWSHRKILILSRNTALRYTQNQITIKSVGQSMKQYLHFHVVQDLLSTLHLQKVITNCYLTLTLGFLLAPQDFYISKHMFLWSTRLKSFLKVVTINNVWLLVLNNICLNSFYLKIQLSSKNKTQYSVHKSTEWNWTKNCFFCERLVISKVEFECKLL